tara:strand:- start:166 stop:375 length:210 start_codon:yes stop_codon:yes gene_type:complete
VPGEGPPFPGEGINIGRVDILSAETFELRAEVIDTDKKNVWPLGVCEERHCEKKSQQAAAIEGREESLY